MSLRPLSLTDPEGCAILRKVLVDADYSHDGLTKALGVSTYASTPLTEFPVLLKALAPGTPLSILIQCFLLGYPVGANDLERVVRPLTLKRLESLGVIKLEAGGASPLVRIRPYRGYLFAADRRPKEIADITRDFVLEINPTSEHLADITPRRRVASALDIGSGCGVLSILAAAHCDKVVATDINPRALNYTAFNAQLNGFANIECVEGSLLDPVAGRTFDLIMSNPPFVISPDSEYLFRDSGWPVDSYCRELVRRMPAALNEGGIAVVICDWALRKG
ncbi:MAG TPA: class I SAM-dependent methyltransferase, partial [Gemmatimonadales bacterium]|nr:class I SAM-dependent methyltransferase [Gemmatimonadales bacterium]